MLPFWTTYDSSYTTTCRTSLMTKLLQKKRPSYKAVLWHTHFRREVLKNRNKVI